MSAHAKGVAMLTRILVLLALAGPVAAAQDLTVFGLTLGQPLTLPVCQWDYRHPDPVCMGSAVTATPSGATERAVYFPDDQAPDVLKVARVSAYEVGGRLVAVAFETAGISTADRVLAALTAKYGAPTATQHEAKQTALGATVEAVTAAWLLPGLHVTFASAPERIDSGRVMVTTPEGSAMIEADAATAGAKRVPL